MSHRGDIPLQEHLVRSARHRKVGEALDPDEWGAVCFFYSAFHLVRHALRIDPVFDDPTALSRINPQLTPGDRHCSRHHGFRNTPRGERIWGINELVTLLYRPIAFDYERLHQASIAVRYDLGLTGLSVNDLLPSLDAVSGAHSRGQLQVGGKPS